MFLLTATMLPLMKITEIRMKPDSNPNSRVLAYCSITLDRMVVVHNIKVIMGEGGPFVSMPTTKHRQPCDKCEKKIDCGSNFCNCCGVENPHGKLEEPTRQFHEVAHPITQACKDQLHSVILETYRKVSGT